MARRKVYLNEDMVKSFVVGQISFGDLTDNIEDPNEHEFVCKNCSYKVSFEDIKKALKHFAEIKADYNTVCNEWFENLYWYLGDMICLPAMIGETGNCIELMDLDSSYARFFFKDEVELANWVICRLDDMDDEQWDWEDKQEHCAETLADILQIIDNFEINKDMPKEDWIFTHSQKENLVFAFCNEKTLAKQDDVIKSFYKQFLEELAAEGNVNAVKELGYAHYGDENPVFECNWEISRDCMLKLMEIAHDEWKAMAANTLGYIYYYGRCNNGVPQYEEAYKYFSLAAFYGYYEAVYKVGDMIRDGRGTFKNEEAAFRMYQWVYGENYQRFLNNSDCVLSDAALRLASCYQHGTGTYKDLKKAYHYYLIARTAIDERMKVSNFFGLNKVSASIRTGLDEVRKELGDEVNQKYALIEMPYFLEHSLLDQKVKKLEVKISEIKAGYNIVIKRISENQWIDGSNLLLCIDDISYCKKTNEFKFYLPKEQMIEDRSEGKKIQIDNYKIKKGEIHFYCKKALIFSTTVDFWQMKAEKRTGSNKMHQFVSIEFEKEGRHYDYLCDGIEVNEGDIVTVPGMQGPVEVKVLRVFEQSEADAPLEITRYKSVIKE